MSSNTEHDYKRFAFLCFAALVGIGCSLLFYPFVKDNGDYAETVVSVFSILSGFIIAIITILGDSSIIFSGSWRVAEKQIKIIKVRMIKQQFVFLVYLITIILIVLDVFSNENAANEKEIISQHSQSIKAQKTGKNDSPLKNIVTFKQP